MARYPSYEEYAKDGKFAEGIKRCNDLLKKNPKDVSLLTTKLQLICASQPSSEEEPQILDQLVATHPPIQDLNELVSIELAVADSFKNTYPPPKTLGPVITKLWDNSYKANTSVEYRSELLTVRYQRAIYDNRIQDVQQTLIQLKQFQPKNRTIYLAHAAYTQLLSTAEGDLQSKLALGLARKAVSEKFDDDKSLDCRVAGQIFALQKSEKDLEGIRERQAFRESKQVYDALQLHRQQVPSAESKREPTELETKVEESKTRFKKLLENNTDENAYLSFVADTIRLFYSATTTLKTRKRGAAEPCFLAISGFVKLYSEFRDEQSYLLQAAFLAEQLLTFDPEIHEARVILVYLYMRLGLGSEAMRLFDSLSIKEVQFDTVGHTLFARLSTIHPFRTELPKGEYFDPHERTNRALQVPARHENKLFEAEAAVLDHKQTGMIFELNGLRDEIRNSFMRRVTLLEHRRMARLSGKGYGRGTSDIGPRVVKAWVDVKDNRDFNATFNFGFNIEQALQRQGGSKVHGISGLTGRSWLIYNLAIDTAYTIASKQIPLVAGGFQVELDSLISAFENNGSAHPLTEPESRVAHIVNALIRASDSSIDIDVLSKRIDDLKIPDLCASTPPEMMCDNLHACYVYIDILLIVAKTCTSPEAATLRATCFGHIRNLQGYATKMSAKGSGKQKSPFFYITLGDLREEKTLEALSGDASLYEFADRVSASAKEAWEGVGKIVMPSSS